MSRRLGVSTVVALLACVLIGLQVASQGPVSAKEQSFGRLVSYRVEVLGSGQPAVLGIVPEDRRLVIRDITSSRIGGSGVLSIAIRADAVTLADVTARMSFRSAPDEWQGGFDAHFESGLVIPGGEELSLLHSESSVGRFFVTVAGVLE